MTRSPYIAFPRRDGHFTERLTFTDRKRAIAALRGNGIVVYDCGTRRFVSHVAHSDRAAITPVHEWARAIIDLNPDLHDLTV